jgi:sugar phosphate isomerase/epimerase
MSISPPKRNLQRIGLQLHTVRSELEKDFERTIAKVAAVGYQEVEFAGYFGHSPEDVRTLLQRYELTAPSTHISFGKLGKQWSEVIGMCQQMGHRYIAVPGVEGAALNQPDGWKRIAAIFNRAGAESRKAGIQFVYHNHTVEFVPVNGRLPYDILLEECDSDLVKMEMDVCWFIAGRQDPVAYFNRYPGRFPLVHVKDLNWLPRQLTTGGCEGPGGLTVPEMADVGSGVVDWKGLFSMSEDAGIQHYFVEHDKPASAFDSVKSSFDYLNNLRF